LAVFLFFVILFWKYGFARAIYKIGKNWMSVLCSALIGPKVSEFLQRLFLRKAITGGIQNALTTVVENNANDYNLEQLFANLPEGFSKFIGNYGVSFEALEAEFGSATYASPEIISAISERLAAPCIDMVSSIIGHVVGFIVPCVFFWWLNRKIRRSRKPFFRIVDRVSGVIIGLCVGYIAVVFASLFLQTMFQVVLAFDMNNGVLQVYEKSFIFRFLSKFDTLGAIRNIFGGLVGKIK